MKRTIFILLMLTGLALNLTKNGWEICGTQTLRAEAWDSADYQDNYDEGWPNPYQNDGKYDPSTNTTTYPDGTVIDWDTYDPDGGGIPGGVVLGDFPDNDDRDEGDATTPPVDGDDDNATTGNDDGYSDLDDDGGYDDGIGDNDQSDDGINDPTDDQDNNETGDEQPDPNNETYDCMGVLNGKAYVNQCGECIDGNKGQIYINTSDQNMNEKIQDVINQMKQNCFEQLLFSNIQSNSGVSVNVDPNLSSPGTYNPCKNQVALNSANGINSKAIGGELFHALQQEFYGNKMTDIKNDLLNDHIGGSNIEFEEKAFYLFSVYLQAGFYGVFPDTEKLYKFVTYFADKYQQNGFPLSFTEEEKSKWFQALEQFQQAHKNEQNLYGKPIDYNLLPTLILTLLNQSKCN